MSIEKLIDDYLQDVPGDEIPRFECAVCGKNIYVGQDYYDINDEPICEACVLDMKTTAD